MIGSVIDKAQKDHVTAFSAQAAFFTILSFFPFMIVLLSLTRYFPITPNDMIELVRTYLPPKYSGMVVPIIRSLNGKLTTTYMSITILTLLWSASKGILSLMTGLNTIHEIPEKRNYFVLRFSKLPVYSISCSPKRSNWLLLKSKTSSYSLKRKLYIFWRLKNQLGYDAS